MDTARQGTDRTLGLVIREAREAAGLTMRDVASRVGLHHSVLGRIESGDVRRPAAEVVQRLAEVLALDERELLRFVGVKQHLPEPTVYFRNTFGVSEEEALEMHRLIMERYGDRIKRDNDNG